MVKQLGYSELARRKTGGSLTALCGGQRQAVATAVSSKAATMALRSSLVSARQQLQAVDTPAPPSAPASASSSAQQKPSRGAAAVRPLATPASTGARSARPASATACAPSAVPTKRVSTPRAATARPAAPSGGAERGLVEMASEIGAALQVRHGVFVLIEGPSTLLESLLKLEEQMGSGTSSSRSL